MLLDVPFQYIMTYSWVNLLRFVHGGLVQLAFSSCFCTTHAMSSPTCAVQYRLSYALRYSSRGSCLWMRPMRRLALFGVGPTCNVMDSSSPSVSGTGCVSHGGVEGRGGKRFVQRFLPPFNALFYFHLGLLCHHSGVPIPLVLAPPLVWWR